jgi:glycosyltransferase involved in cell wall biosynthesis
MEDLVSIITPSYNSSKYIEKTIQSVIEQTYKKWELLIIDDCSNDNSVQIVNKYIINDDRIKLYQLEKNSGVAIARNYGIKKAKGTFIAFLDSDDIWLPNKLEVQLSFMKKNKLLLTYSSYQTIDEYNRLINIRVAKEDLTYDDMLKSNHIGNLTGIYNCSKLGKFYMEQVGHEDYLHWLAVMKKAKKTKGIHEPLAQYRILQTSISSNKIKVLKWQWDIYRNHLKFNIFKSIYYFVFYIYYALKKRT